jgi:hypothetical protein
MNPYLDATEILWEIVQPAYPTLDIPRMKRAWEHILFNNECPNGEMPSFRQFSSANVTSAGFRQLLNRSLTELLSTEYRILIGRMCNLQGAPEYEALQLVIQRYQEWSQGYAGDGSDDSD